MTSYFWVGRIGYVNTTTADDRVLKQSPTEPLRHRELPLPLIARDAHGIIDIVGQINRVLLGDNAIHAKGTINIAKPNTPWAATLLAGQPVSVGLRVVGGQPVASTVLRTTEGWSIAGVTIIDDTAAVWPDAQIHLVLMGNSH